MSSSEVSVGEPAAKVGAVSSTSTFSRGWQWYRRGWFCVLWHVLGGLLWIPYLTVSLAAVLGVIFTVTLAGAGLVLAVPALALAVGAGRMELWLARALLGADLEPLPEVVGTFWRRRVANPNYWRYLTYLLLRSLWSLIVSLLLIWPLVVSGSWREVMPGAAVALGWPISSAHVGGMILTQVLGVLWLLAFVPGVSLLISPVDKRLLGSLISSVDRGMVKQLSDEVSSLTQARKFMVESIGAERQRIERDLHDGPQQMLTSVAMDLGLALRQLDRDPTAARPHVERAHAAAKEATVSLRQVIRAVHPPVLTERGLAAAVSALAGRSALPVRVRSQLDYRFDPAVEAALYFCVSEALTNVVKHAEASSVTVEMFSSVNTVLVVVRDDGKGGAVEPQLEGPAGGSGLAGLRKRLLGVQGDVELSSPAGGGTTLTFTAPYDRGAYLE